ncbi:MAG: glycine--tRNA ligase subunit beta [Burkholderiales bacterium 34-67-9]|nr:MAG: glycine--tRNA ligase subunit beta [Burkholderiales bacterium 34-67-9]
MHKHNLLVELLVEELPPKALKKLGEAFAGVLAEQLQAQGLAEADARLTSFASPRRLAAHICGVAARAPDRPVAHKLMPVSVGLDASGAPTPALLKRLAALGADATAVPGLRRAADGKAEALYLDSVQPGVSLAVGLQKALDEALARLPIPKVMSYQPESHGNSDGASAAFVPGWSSVHFVRPAHGLVALHGAEVVAVHALGLRAGRSTRGHRFEAAVDPLPLPDADSYAATLRTQGAVIASYAERSLEMVRQLRQAAASLGARLEVEQGCAGLSTEEIEQRLLDDALVQEVTALVERPTVLVCAFERQFLEVPQECLILTMKANQKYFPLLDAQGRLSHQFLVVSNINPADPSAVIAGNERVVRPRLADARFFYDQDRKRSLESRLLGLAKVVYHNRLGSQGERVERVRAIAGAIAQRLGDAALQRQVEQAALLAKADLLTDMVGEFPELQGIMGRTYALHDGLEPVVAEAIEDHYKPRFAGDALPRNPVGLCVALADKLETLVGLFGIGSLPSGDKDPYALRRHALGVLRMWIERDLPLDWAELLALARPVFGDLITDPSAALTEFVFERLAGSLREQGYGAHEVDAVLALRPTRLAEVPRRLEAVRAFAALPQVAALAAANKRIGNILKKSAAGAPAAPSASDAGAAQVQPQLLAEPAEQALYAALQTTLPQTQAQFEAGDYRAHLLGLAALHGPVDAFFESVLVNADDPAVRANRLALLHTLHQAMNRVAELARLA